MTRVLLIVAMLVAIAAGIAYGVYWKAVHDRALALLDQEIAAWRAAGYDVEWQSRTTGGFPLRIEAVFNAATIASPQDEEPWTWAGERLVVHLRPWAFDTITIEPEGLNSATTQEYGVLDADAENFSITVQADAVGVRSLGITGRHAAVVDRSNGDTIAAAESLSAIANRDEADTGLYRVIGGVDAPEWRGDGDAAPERISFDAEVGALDRLAAEGDLDPAALAAWVAAGGGLGIHDLRAMWPDSELGANGVLSLDQRGEWNGEVAIDSRSPSRAFAHLAAMGAIDTRAATQAGAVADALVTGEDRSARLAFELRSGEVYLLGLRLGRVEPAY